MPLALLLGLAKGAWSFVSGLFGGSAAGGGSRALLGLALAGALAGAAWLLHDWHATAIALARQEMAAEQAEQAHRQKEAVLAVELLQARADIAAARATSARRATDAADLASQIDSLRTVVVPDDQAGCTLPAVLDAALDRLRR